MPLNCHPPSTQSIGPPPFSHLPPLAEGQQVVHGDGESVPHVEGRVAAIVLAVTRVLGQRPVGATAESLAHRVDRVAPGVREQSAQTRAGTASRR